MEDETGVHQLSIDVAVLSTKVDAISQKVTELSELISKMVLLDERIDRFREHMVRMEKRLSKCEESDVNFKMWQKTVGRVGLLFLALVSGGMFHLLNM